MQRLITIIAMALATIATGQETIDIVGIQLPKTKDQLQGAVAWMGDSAYASILTEDYYLAYLFDMTYSQGDFEEVLVIPRTIDGDIRVRLAIDDFIQYDTGSDVTLYAKAYQEHIVMCLVDPCGLGKNSRYPAYTFSVSW